MDELNKIKKEIEEKEKTMAGEKVVTTNSENKPVVTPEVSSNQNKVVFTPEVKESQVSDGLNRTKKSSEEVGDMVADIFKQGVVHVVSTDQGVQNEILGTAKKAVKDKVGAISSQTTKEAQESAYDANQDACENYGIMRDVPLWKIALMKAGSAFWFIIYFIFASVTVAPITIFLKGLVGVIKQVWLAAIVAIFFYLAIAVGLPLILSIV
jgi:hypothetical protein